jgi:hypothetical protein
MASDQQKRCWVCLSIAAAPVSRLRMAVSERIPALLSSDDYGSSVERVAHGQVLWRVHMRAADASAERRGCVVDLGVAQAASWPRVPALTRSRRGPSAVPDASTATAVSEALCGSIPILITNGAPMVAGTGTAVVGTLTCRTVAMPLSSHTTAGAGQLGTLLRSQPEGGKRSADLCRPAPWTLRAAAPRASTADSTSQRSWLLHLGHRVDSDLVASWLKRRAPTARAPVASSGLACFPL